MSHESAFKILICLFSVVALYTFIKGAAMGDDNERKAALNVTLLMLMGAVLAYIISR